MHHVVHKWMGVKCDLFGCNWGTAIRRLLSYSSNKEGREKEWYWLASPQYDSEAMPLFHCSFIISSSSMLNVINNHIGFRELIKTLATCLALRVSTLLLSPHNFLISTNIYIQTTANETQYKDVSQYKYLIKRITGRLFLFFISQLIN